MSEKKGYIQVRTPDVSRIAEIVLVAKGVERTMAKFAEDTGINPSTLSRIVNGKIKKPLTMDVIEAVIDKKSSSCEISMEELIRANGMMEQEAYEHRSHRDPFIMRRRAADDRMVSMKTIILNELYRRSIAYKKVRRDEIEEMPMVVREFGSMQRILLNMLESENENYWGFVFNSSIVDPEELETGYVRRDVRYFMNRVLSIYGSIFLADAWEPETLENMKCSFVFCDEHFYDVFRERLSRAKIQSSMTMILLNIEEAKVVKEELLPGCSFENQDNYFDIPIDDADDGTSNYDDELHQLIFRFDDEDD